MLVTYYPAHFPSGNYSTTSLSLANSHHSIWFLPWRSSVPFLWRIRRFQILLSFRCKAPTPYPNPLEFWTLSWLTLPDCSTKGVSFQTCERKVVTSQVRGDVHRKLRWNFPAILSKSGFINKLRKFQDCSKLNKWNSRCVTKYWL